MRRASCQVGCAAPLEHTPPALLQHAAFLGQQKAQEGGGGSMGWTVGCWPPDRRACPPCAPAPPGFGQLHPRSQGITTLGTIYSSSLFPGRVPTGQVLLLSYFGGAQNRRVADMSDEELVEQVDKDLRQMLVRPDAPKPRKVAVRVWPRAIPQVRLCPPTSLLRCLVLPFHSIAQSPGVSGCVCPCCAGLHDTQARCPNPYFSARCRSSTLATWRLCRAPSRSCASRAGTACC
jgi:hypothetical protein